MNKYLIVFYLIFFWKISGCINPQKVGNPKKTVASMAKTIELQYPKIKHLSIEKYQKQADNYILLDVRSSEESKVSQIPNSITKEEFEKNKESYRGKKIVTYCTIGVRSSKYAQELEKQGFEAANLKESILGWTHRKLPLVNNQGRPTKKVHVYGEAWNLVSKEYEGIWED